MTEVTGDSALCVGLAHQLCVSVMKSWRKSVSQLVFWMCLNLSSFRPRTRDVSTVKTHPNRVNIAHEHHSVSRTLVTSLDAFTRELCCFTALPFALQPLPSRRAHTKAQFTYITRKQSKKQMHTKHFII